MSLEDLTDLALGGREWKVTRGAEGEGREGGKVHPPYRPHSGRLQGEKSLCEGVSQLAPYSVRFKGKERRQVRPRARKGGSVSLALEFTMR